MLEFTLKFLSGESRKYIVDDSATVRQFKERLSHELNIPIERQRIIFQGKVLQDDTKLADSNIHEKTLHFVERAEPIPPAASTANTSNTSAPNVSASGHASGGINQTLLDDVNETTSIFINGLPGSTVLQPNDIQTLVRNLLSDLGDVGRQAQVNTTMASDGHGVDVNIDFGNINQILEQQEIHERFRSIGRMLARLRHRIDHIQQIVDSNFRQISTPPPPAVPSSSSTTTIATTSSGATNISTSERPVSPIRPTTTTSTTFIGMEDITGTEMDTDSQGPTESSETMHTPPSTTSNTPVENASTPTTTANNTNTSQTPPRSARDLAELYETVQTGQNRLQRYYQTYLSTLTQGESFGPELAGRQRFYSLFNEANHLIAHIHHNLTDFTLDLNDPIENRLLHLGELPISQAGLNTIAQATGQGLGSNADLASRGIPRSSRSFGRRPGALATARIMGPIQISTGPNGGIISGDLRMPMQNPLGGFPRMVFNHIPRQAAPIRPVIQQTVGNNGAGQGLRFNLGTLPYTFMQMAPDGITLNQVSASIVADVQTGAVSPSSSSTTSTTTTSSTTNRTTVTPHGTTTTHVISSGPIQLDADNLDANLAAEIAQRVTNSVQQHLAQIVNQQINNSNSGSTNQNVEMMNLNPPTASSSTETLRSRSADSRTNNRSTSTGATSNVDDDDADWIDLPMETPNTNNLPTNNLSPNPVPRLRVPTIIQSVDRSLPCTSPYFTQAVRTIMEPSNSNTSTSQRPRARHRHPAGPWAQQQQQQQQQQQLQSSLIPNFIMNSGGTSAPYSMTAHSFEIPMPTSNPSMQTANGNNIGSNDSQGQMNAVIGQVLSQILPGVLRSGNGRVRLNIGQNNSPNGTNATTPSNPQASNTSTTQTGTTTNMPNLANIPGVIAGGLDFSNIARTIGNMVQSIAGQTVPSATTSETTSTTTRPTNQNTSSTSNASDSDRLTEQMVSELFRLLQGGLNNPELDNLTIGSFMQRFGEDVESRSNDGTNLISELFSSMTSTMRFTDVWNLVLGNSVGPRINEARRVGVEYLRTTLINGRAVTSEVIDEMADRLYESLLREASINLNELRAKPNMNLSNIIKRFFKHHARKLLEILLNGSADGWFTEFRQQLSAMQNECLALLSHCLEGGESAALDFILERHRAIFRSTNPMIVTWSETYLRSSIQNAFNNIRATPPNISNYLVEPQPTPSPMNMSYTSQPLRRLDEGIRVSATSSAPVPPPAPAAALASAATTVAPTTTMASTTSTSTVSDTNISNNLPEDWIPIVIRDINTQRDLTTQPAFSDAYREGMPSKRRRVHLREDLTSSNLLQTLVLRATPTNNNNSANAHETPAMVLAGQEASSTLINSFEDELKRLLQQRIRQDRDYQEVQHRMPNTKRYLSGEK